MCNYVSNYTGRRAIFTTFYYKVIFLTLTYANILAIDNALGYLKEQISCYLSMDYHQIINHRFVKRILI